MSNGSFGTILTMRIGYKGGRGLEVYVSESFSRGFLLDVGCPGCCRRRTSGSVCCARVTGCGMFSLGVRNTWTCSVRNDDAESLR